MPDPNKVEVIFELLKKGSGAQDAVKDLKEVGNAAKEGSASFEGLTKSFERFLAVVGVERILHTAIDNFLELDRTIAKLEGSLHSTGQYTQEYSAFLQDMAEQLSKVSLYHKAEILNVEALLVSFDR